MTNPGVGLSQAGTQPNVNEQTQRVVQALKGPAGWFATVAALSILNSILLSMSGASLHFIFGLGITQVVDALARQAGSAGYVLDFIINGVIAGVFVLIWNLRAKDNPGRGTAGWLSISLTDFCYWHSRTISRSHFTPGRSSECILE